MRQLRGGAARLLPILVAVATPIGQQILSAADKDPKTLQKVDTLSITATKGGLYPTRVTRPAGKFALFINNVTGLPQVTLRVDKDQPNTLNANANAIGRASDMRGDSGKRRFSTFLDLAPGTYVLWEASDPSKVCTIIVTAR